MHQACKSHLLAPITRREFDKRLGKLSLPKLCWITHCTGTMGFLVPDFSLILSSAPWASAVNHCANVTCDFNSGMAELWVNAIYISFP